MIKHAFQNTRDGYYRRLPIDDKLIVFEAFLGTKYADSPRVIYEYLLGNEAYDDYKFIWLFKNPEKYTFLEANGRTKVIKRETNAYYAAFARAKYWVVNGWIPLRVQKKTGQIALQCWHGTPLKRLRYDIITVEETTHQRNAQQSNDRDIMRYDYLLSPSRFATRVFTSAFNLKKLKKEDIIIELGYPRNDVLVNATADQMQAFRQKYAIPEGKKVLLYAPTWRDDQHVEGKGYEYQTPVNFDLLQEKIADEYIVLFRAHNMVANPFDFSKYDGFVRDVSQHDDISDLYLAADALMTDYSSVFFDYANLRRPIIFFMYDLEHYKDHLRGFYIDLKELPGDIVKTEEAVATILGDLSAYQQKYQKTYQAFTEKYNALDDGRATERVVDRVFGDVKMQKKERQ